MKFLDWLMPRFVFFFAIAGFTSHMMEMPAEFTYNILLIPTGWAAGSIWYDITHPGKS